MALPHSGVAFRHQDNPMQTWTQGNWLQANSSIEVFPSGDARMCQVLRDDTQEMKKLTLILKDILLQSKDDSTTLHIVENLL